MDPEYLEMMNYIESNTDDNDITPDCEFYQKMHLRDKMSLYDQTC